MNPVAGGGNPGTLPPPPGNVAVSGVVTFDRVPFSRVAESGLDFSMTQAAPARGVTVEALSGNSVLASTQTSALGSYSLALPANTNVSLRVKAEMLRAGTPSWTFRVRDNTSGNALYALTGTAFDTGTGGTVTRNLHAASGWSISSDSYTGPRAAAPFAILDDIYLAVQLVLSGDPQAEFPPLDVFWSPNNQPSVGDPDIPNGDIGTTFFLPGEPTSSIYVLGAENVDTDEFDSHVIEHEWGHYYQFAFSRDDSVGGEHEVDEKLDLRVAFSEGWGDAFSGMALQDPVYRDSFDSEQSSDFNLNMESGTIPDEQRGWFSEGSVGLLLYDLFDGADAEAESVHVGFDSIHAAMGALQTTDAFAGIHPFINALLPLESAQAADIQSLLRAQKILDDPDDFAIFESNDGGDPENLPILPIYKPISVGATVNVCSTGTPGQIYNKLGNRSFLRLNLDSSFTGSISVSTPNDSWDADVVLFHQGVEMGRRETGADDVLPVGNLAAGTYVIETYESTNVFGDPSPVGRACIDVAVEP